MKNPFGNFGKYDRKCNSVDNRSCINAFDQNVDRNE